MILAVIILLSLNLSEAVVTTAVDCNTCPSGLYTDGCNDCYCLSGKPTCTTRTCVWEGIAHCIDCDGCDTGYFDGCNTCTCNKDGTASCTDIACHVQSAPYCTVPDEPTTTEAVFDGCTECTSGSWFDGCNECSCDSDGSVACTKIYCEVYKDPYCNEPSDISTTVAVEWNCETCPYGFSDGCNECSCNNGNIATCTDHVCVWAGYGYCYDCEKCPHGFNDGCNDCFCDGDAVVGCTEIACTTYGLPQCSSADITTTEADTAAITTEADNAGTTDEAETVTGSTTSVPQEWNCETCPYGFSDGCNECSCNNGNIATCTEYVCVWAGIGSCYDCEKCPHGFNDGCNECFCDDNAVGCTEMACSNYGLPECSSAAITTTDADTAETEFCEESRPSGGSFFKAEVEAGDVLDLCQFCLCTEPAHRRVCEFIIQQTHDNTDLEDAFNAECNVADYVHLEDANGDQCDWANIRVKDADVITCACDVLYCVGNPYYVPRGDAVHVSVLIGFGWIVSVISWM